MEPLKPQSINYKKIEQVSGKYRFNRVSINNITGSTIPLSANSSTVIEFKLPVGVYNLARSFLSYTNNIASTTVNTIVYDNTLSIASSIQFGTSGGLNLCDLQYANNYINVVRPIDTPVDTFLSNDITSCMSPVIPIVTTSIANTNNIFPPSYGLPANNMYNIPVATQVLNPLPNAIIAARQSFALTQPSTNAVVFSLSGVTNTILAMDKDQYFPENMYLRITTAPSYKVGYLATLLDNPVGGAAVLVAQPVLNNVSFYLAMEKDQLIIDSLMSKYASGKLRYQIPFVTSYRNAVAVGNSTIQLQLNSGNGKKLKRVVTTFYHVNEATTPNLAYDHCNVNGVKCASYQTYLDNMPIQDSLSSCLAPTNTVVGLDDWRENRQTCKGSAIKSALEYSQNWFHADRFYEKNETTDIQSDNIDEGLSLATPKAWSIQANMAMAGINYTFCNLIKDISVSPAGVLFV